MEMISRYKVWPLTCLIMTFISISAVFSFSGCTKKKSSPNVLLIVVDALRADKLGAYGYERDTSPFFDTWSSKGALFENVTSQSSWTKTSMASMLTGLEAETVQVFFYEDTLPDEALTIAEILSRRGYQTAYVQTNQWLLDKFGFNQGFEDYSQLGPVTEKWPEKKSAYRAWAVNEQARLWLEGRDRSRPFFLYLHYMDVHGPYVPPPPHNRIFDPEFPRELRDYIFSIKFLYEQEFSETAEELYKRLMQEHDLLAHLRSLYDGEIHYFDKELEKLMSGLEEMGLVENTLIVFASDHGEQFLEHGKLRHANSLYAEEVKVPLVFSLPGAIKAGNRVSRPVRNTDILPTVLDIIGIKEEGLETEGRSLLSHVKGRSDNLQEAPAFSRLRSSGGQDNHAGEELDCASIRYGEWALIRDFSNGSNELYNVVKDPGEKNNMVNEYTDTFNELSLRLEDQLEKSLKIRTRLGLPSTPVKTTIDEDTRRKLEAAGYFRK